MKAWLKFSTYQPPDFATLKYCQYLVRVADKRFVL